jgi:hypothetical protein
MMFVFRVVSLIVSMVLCFPYTVFADSRSRARIFSPEEFQSVVRGNEFVSGNYPGALLIPVNLWGAIPKAGTHHVPVETRLLDLVSYAGGPRDEADLEEATIRRKTVGGDEVIRVDLKKLITKPGQSNILLEPNDIIYIPPKADEGPRHGIMKTALLVATVLGAVVSAIVISDRFSKGQSVQAPIQ